MSLEQIVKYYKMRDLSGSEIENLIGKPPILYSDLKHFGSIEQVLGKEGYCVVLYQTSSKTVGHFVALTRGEGGKLRFADSYGLYPDAERQYTQYDEAIPAYLTRLLEGTNFEYNKTDWQSWKHGVSTCGRFSSLFCLFRNLSLAQIEELFKMNQSAFLKDTDNVAVLLTLIGLDNIQEYGNAISRSR